MRSIVSVHRLGAGLGTFALLHTECFALGVLVLIAMLQLVDLLTSLHVV